MPKLTIVVGLPNAGKSTYCQDQPPGGMWYGDVCQPGKTPGRNPPGDVIIELIRTNDCLIEDVSLSEAKQRKRVADWVMEKRLSFNKKHWRDKNEIRTPRFT